jgi:hypothetical protein
MQGRIQDFKLGEGAHLKKLRRAEGGAKIFGVFRVKNLQWFDGECKNAREKYKSSKDAPKRLEQTTLNNETKHLEKEYKKVMKKVLENIRRR